ncbi:MAG: secondary thiamine-phosphate synthase enzyme YjbQ [Proteobacteria bacterium]|nr:secondary thiamine-phosphate synthase enzyme YjbQ [Pseudomonadota bacterium]
MKYKTKGTFTNITKDIEVDIENGICVIFTPHTTCGVKILEDESLLVRDMESFLERIAPKCGVYAHDDIEKRDVPPTERINGYSHIRAMVLPQSLTVPVKDGKLTLGKWQSIFLIELDGNREREVIVKCIQQ